LRREIPLIITFAIGFMLLFAIFLPFRPFPGLDEELSIWFDIIAVFAFILGGGNLIRVHGNKIYKRSKDWMYSIVCLAGFFLMLFFGVFQIGGPITQGGGYTSEGVVFQWMYDAVFYSSSATIFSLLAFFVASAAYRAFRARTVEAAILLCTAFVILTGRTFLGAFLTGWLPKFLEPLHIPNLFNWILSTPNQAGQRAIMIGIALGIISTSLKIILGIERSYLGGD
jgi:hypothetical protein